MKSLTIFFFTMFFSPFLASEEMPELHIAVVSDNPKANIQSVLQKENIDPNRGYGSSGVTALQFAIIFGIPEEALRLILDDPRTDPNLRALEEAGHASPLDWAVLERNQMGLDTLLSYEHVNPNSQNSLGDTSFHMALHKKNVEAMERLLKRLDTEVGAKELKIAEKLFGEQSSIVIQMRQRMLEMEQVGSCYVN